MMRLTLKLAFIFFLFQESASQDRYWTDKKNLNTLQSYEISPDFCSQWLKQCSFSLPDHLESEIKAKIDVVSVRQLVPTHATESESKLIGFALEQVRGSHFIKKGLDGTGVKIGIIDGGFLGAKESPNLRHLFKSGRVSEYRDFITPNMEPYSGSAILDDMHGTEVWHLIGGIHEEKNIQYGIATQSEYFLARTDHGAYEKRIEEDYLIAALEWLHSEGVRLVNISLGYATGFSDSRENYTPEQMDGKTSITSRALDTAFYRKNMIPVVAAGNEGTDSHWRVLSTPGDAKGCITVGATKLKIWEKLDYSSVGTDNLPFIKPDVSCFATMGTSFSTPIVTGIVAGMLQYDSSLSSVRIKEILHQSAHLYPYGNNFVGFGVPDCREILSLLEGDAADSINVTYSSKRKVVKEIPKEINYVVAYHKDGYEVQEREVIRPKRGKLKIKKSRGLPRTTVFLQEKSFEIIWQ